MTQPAATRRRRKYRIPAGPWIVEHRLRLGSWRNLFSNLAVLSGESGESGVKGERRALEATVIETDRADLLLAATNSYALGWARILKAAGPFSRFRTPRRLALCDARDARLRLLDKPYRPDWWGTLRVVGAQNGGISRVEILIEPPNAWVPDGDKPYVHQDGHERHTIDITFRADVRKTPHEWDKSKIGAATPDDFPDIRSVNAHLIRGNGQAHPPHYAMSAWMYARLAKLRAPGQDAETTALRFHGPYHPGKPGTGGFPRVIPGAIPFTVGKNSPASDWTFGGFAMPLAYLPDPDPTPR